MHPRRCTPGMQLHLYSYASGCQAGRVGRRKRDAALPLADTRRATRLSLPLCLPAAAAAAALGLSVSPTPPPLFWPLHANWQTSAELAYRDRPAIFANYDARPTPREPASQLRATEIPDTVYADIETIRCPPRCTRHASLLFRLRSFPVSRFDILSR